VAASDRNRSRKLAAVRRLQELMKELESPEFKGYVSLEIHGAGGKIGGIRYHVSGMEPEEE
jgi:hypothetical protein